MQFTELPLCDALQEGLEAMNFKETTPVQELAIPVILAKKDLIACAQTGTGKTAAFLLPLLNNLQTEPHDENKVNAIIMAPTRELAQQIDQQMEGFSYFTPFSSVAVYGGNDGEAWEVQKKGLLSGADVVIATPGRLLSHINLYNIDFSGVKYFILDEADRMLDMGFYDDIMKIEKLLPKDRQTVMFSATMPPKIQQLAKTILRNPEEINIALSRPPEAIMQSAYICYDAQKMELLKHLFKEKKPNKVILFSGSKQKVKDIARTLRKMGLSAGEMHSDLDQTQRNHVMHEFRNERVDILVATDIVARGIDIDDITLVINYDVPYDAEDYVHRIGRTARAGDSGMSITFVSPSEQTRFSMIEKFLWKTIYKIPVPAELGDAPAYNPTRESGPRRSSSRAAKGDKKKYETTLDVPGDVRNTVGENRQVKVIDAGTPEQTGDRQTDGTAQRGNRKDKTGRSPREAVDSRKTDKQQQGREGGEHSISQGRGASQTKEASRTTGASRTTEASQNSGKVRERKTSQEKPTPENQKQGTTGKQAGKQREKNQPQKQETSQTTAASRHTEASQVSGKQREQKVSHKQNSQHREVIASGAIKETAKKNSQHPQNIPAKQPGEQPKSAKDTTAATETDGKKRKWRWSWWPFGKK